jgi:paraquat-inducible protein B
MMIGGVGFDAPSGDAAPPADEGAVFPLHSSKRDVDVEQFALKQRYLVHFRGSVRGLEVGSPVEFRGIRVGQVADVRLQYDGNTEDLSIPVVIEIEPERIGMSGGDPVQAADRLGRLVERGLRAQLKSGNLLTGQLLVDLDLHPKLPPESVKIGGTYPEIPTIPTPLDELAGSVARILEKVEKLPLDELTEQANGAIRELHGTLEQTRKITEKVAEGLVPRVDGTLGQTQSTLAAAEGTLRAVERMFGADSAVNVELSRTLSELASAARALRGLADHLDRHPEDLIRGGSAK